MKNQKMLVLVFALMFVFFSWIHLHGEVSLKTECLKTLVVLVDALIDQQVNDNADTNFGALRCARCDVFHTRAAEAVYPFSVAYKHTGDSKYLSAAIHLGDWLIRQQLQDGEWQETPEEWTGTTTDQLLMMVCAFPILEEHLNEKQRENWETCIRKAADYLTRVMSPEFASINYCATTCASLAMTNHVFPEERYLEKAKALTIQVVSRMDEHGFISGEGGRIYGIKYGVDVEYEIDMSLWGLGLYARLTEDSFVNQKVVQSLKNHLYFVYPDGSIDGSWGIRSNKWTTYGSKTADGCQILFSLYTEKDPRYRTAAIRNLEYLRKMIKNGFVGYGPHFWDLFDTPPCIYPTFVRSKNLAMTIEFGDQVSGVEPRLPTEETGWFRHFTSVDVVMVRSKKFLSTVTAYRYKDLKNKNKSKYMHRPAGGSISNLWVEGHGFLQTSSQTEYHRWEPMHFPEAEGIICLTPRIEFENQNGYFTNLYEFDGRISIREDKERELFEVSTSGEMKDKELFPGGVFYTWKHIFFNDAIEKSVQIRYHGQRPQINIVEPVVQHPGMKFELLNPGTVIIRGEKMTLCFEIIDGKAQIELGRDESRYWSPFPSLKCYPVELIILNPHDEFIQAVSYRISIQK